jgi:hypothetical protein
VRGRNGIRACDRHPSNDVSALENTVIAHREESPRLSV